MAKCNMDCLNCSYGDCINDKITAAERQQQDKCDTDIKGFYKHGKELAIWKYNHSEKGKANQKRYLKSEKGKATQRRYGLKKIASGKNAEYCRAYYYRKKAEREALQCQE